MDLNTPTILVLAGVGIAVCLALFFLLRNRGKGCSSCNGDCSSCRQKKSK